MKKLVFSLALLALNFSLTAQNKANTPKLAVAFEDEFLAFTWDLSREINTSYFVLESAPEASTDFKPVHTEKARGYSHFTTNYSYEHFTLSGNLKYRVVLVMMDGTRVYSNTLHIPAADFKPIDTASSIVTK